MLREGCEQMTRKEVFKAVDEVLTSAMHEEKNKALFQSGEWAKYELHYKRAKNNLDVMEAGTSVSGFIAFDFDVSIAELIDFIKENHLCRKQ